MKRATRSLSGLLLLLASSCSAVGDKSSRTVPARPMLRAAACDFPIADDRKARLSCHTLSVPRDYGNPSAGTYDLAVVVIKAAAPVAGVDPVLILHGGPGSGATASMGRMRSEFWPAADTVVFDQRGAARSAPHICRDLAPEKLAAIAAPGTFDETARSYAGVHLRCRAQFEAAGVRPEHFGTRITARDAEQLRLAVGAGRWNVHAISAGTAVALEMLAARPQTLRAVVLDAPVVPDPDAAPGGDDYDAALNRIFALCGQDASCARAYPSLPSHFKAAVAGFDADPLAVPAPPGLVPADSVSLNGGEFEYFAVRMLGSVGGIERFPALVTAAFHRDATTLGKMLEPAFEAEAKSAVIGRAAPLCREIRRYRTPMVPTRGPQLSQLNAVCPSWGPLGRFGRVPSNTGVPVLTMGGALDPGRKPGDAAAVARRLGSKAQTVLFPRAAHGVWNTGDCAGRIVAAFYRDPGQRIDAACAQEQPPLRFSVQ